jgi:hypothetical protein
MFALPSKLNPEDAGSIIFWNVGYNLQHYKVSQRISPKFGLLPPWTLQVSNQSQAKYKLGIKFAAPALFT